MNAVTVIRARGAIPRVDESGQLALDLSRVPHDQRAEVVALARQHKTDIINELSGGPSGSPSPVPSPWACPLGHREFWLSDYGLKICVKCHPRPVKGGAAWKQ